LSFFVCCGFLWGLLGGAVCVGSHSSIGRYVGPFPGLLRPHPSATTSNNHHPLNHSPSKLTLAALVRGRIREERDGEGGIERRGCRRRGDGRVAEGCGNSRGRGGGGGGMGGGKREIGVVDVEVEGGEGGGGVSRVGGVG